MNFILSIRYINRYDICNIVFIHSSGDGNLGCFNVLAIVNDATINIGVLIFPHDHDFISFRYIPRSVIAGSYGGSILNF